jgi:hypothetical protein
VCEHMALLPSKETAVRRPSGNHLLPIVRLRLALFRVPLRFPEIRCATHACTAGRNGGGPDRSDGMYPFGGCDDEHSQAHAGSGYDNLTGQVAVSGETPGVDGSSLDGINGLTAGGGRAAARCRSGAGAD